MTRNMWSPNGLPESVASTITVKQGFPLSSLSSVSIYMREGLETFLMVIAIQILVYANAIVLISNSRKRLQNHLNAFNVSCTYKGMLIKMDKTKEIAFHTTQA